MRLQCSIYNKFGIHLRLNFNTSGIFSSNFIGKECKFIVNTVNAGSGALNVGISGPSKAELRGREVDEGYEFSYTPMAPGDYLITIKYAGNSHIPGSPFKAHIEG